MPLPPFRFLCASTILGTVAFASPVFAQAGPWHGVQLTGSAEADIYAAATSGPRIADSAGDGTRPTGVMAVGGRIGLDGVARRPTSGERGEVDGLALLPGADWTDRWGAALHLDVAANFDEWVLDARGPVTGAEVDIYDVGDDDEEIDVAVYQELHLALGVVEVSQRLGFQGPVGFDDAVWLSNRDTLALGARIDVPTVVRLGRLDLGWLGVGYDAWVDVRRESPSDALERARGDVTLTVGGLRWHRENERDGVTLTAAEVDARFMDYDVDYDAGTLDAVLETSEARATHVEVTIAGVDGVALGPDATFAAWGGTSTIALPRDTSTETIGLWGEDPTEASDTRDVSAVPLLGVRWTRWSAGTQTSRPWGDAAGLTNRELYPALEVELETFHRLAPDGLGVDAGARLGGRRTFLVPGDVRFVVEGDLIAARRHAVSDLASGRAAFEQGDALWLGRAAFEAQRRVGGPMHLYARGWYEHSDRADATTAGDGARSVLHDDMGVLVGLRFAQ